MIMIHKVYYEDGKLKYPTQHYSPNNPSPEFLKKFSEQHNHLVDLYNILERTPPSRDIYEVTALMETIHKHLSRMPR